MRARHPVCDHGRATSTDDAAHAGPKDAGAGGAAPTVRRTPFPASDANRNQTSLGIAAVLTVIGFFVYNAFRPLSLTIGTVALPPFGFWIFYALGYLCSRSALSGAPPPPSCAPGCRRRLPGAASDASRPP